MYYLDTANGIKMFKEARGHTYFVDKSPLIGEIYRYAQKESKYIAITRPRRFGKTMAANMLAAFFTQGLDGREAFDGLSISKDAKMWPLRNSFHVIHMDFLAELGSTHSYQDFINLIGQRIVMDLREAFPDLVVSEVDDVPSLLSKTGEQFVFIFDEWDAVFEKRFMTQENREDYILFLRGLFKNRAYVRFALLTGILPIAKYTSGSPLNMFREFNAFAKIGFEKYYGFSEEEILGLMSQRATSRMGNRLASKEIQEETSEDISGETPKETPEDISGDTPEETSIGALRESSEGLSKTISNDISMEDIRLWYDGYQRRADGCHMFNPDSVCNALEEGQCRNFWKGTGPMNDISNLIAENAFSVREDILRMVAGEKIAVRLDGFGVEEPVPRTKRDLLSAMVAYGFLAYHDGLLSIPNLELSQKFADVLDRGTLGVTMTLEESRILLDATLAGRAKEVASRIEAVHDEQIPFIRYCDENSLACVIIYAYYGALDWYEIHREEKSGKGYVDFLFTPVNRMHIPIIMELKYNRSAKAAIRQIREKNYILRMRRYPEVLLVGINFSEKTKKHTCLIERTSYAREMGIG